MSLNHPAAEERAGAPEGGLPSRYDHTKESQIYDLWEQSGYFNPDNLPAEGEPYTIIMPPPNANAPLHVGHALFVTIEDTLIRYQRMQGKRALWLPGFDHAGFETQVVFEKKLDKEGRSRFQMQREEFYKEVWDFVDQNKYIAENGLKRLGASCDWSRKMFTLDPRIVKIVYATFAQMIKDGLVYRGSRTCNWCPKHQTGLADLETKHEERTDTFYYFKYGPFVIGTARPETKFGDKYVVMHPDDERYQQYEDGQKIDLEWINGPITATVIKDAAVDMTFGTGAMTITPWHDPVDFEIAQRHNLDKEQVIDLRGKLLPIAGEFAGMKIAEARPKIVEKLREKGLLVEDKVDTAYKHNVQVCYKCGTIIEPQIIPQWYIAMTKPLPDGRPSLRDMAVAAVQAKEVDIVTERFQKIFMHWMENLRDWPISRQIWWGIPIPIKYCDGCGETIVDTEDAITQCPKCGGGNLRKDPDTFDTWFSSGQWPFATLQALGGKDFETYFPTQLMGTGWDIIFFWVARMIMFSYYRTGKPPFEKVYLTGLVRDKDRQKMSKSKGNVIDPLGVVDTYGTDALRFALVYSTAAGNDIPLAEDKIKGMRHFANKLWNIARFVIAKSAGAQLQAADAAGHTAADQDIFAKAAELQKAVTADMNELHFHEAAQKLYQFAWYEFADIYIEQSKTQLDDATLTASTQQVLLAMLLKTITLLHPFMPFVTEAIYQEMLASNALPPDAPKLLMVKRWE